MLWSRMMLKTQRHAATEAELPSHRLILRAGLARRLAAGIYSLTPLAYRAIRRIEVIVREEMERVGGQELLLPVVQPAELWQETGRYETITDGLARLRDRTERAMVLAMTHEEAVTDLARSVIGSYRQLPQLVFQIQTKFRDEPRPRGGLVRLREFLMKDAYSFHATQEDFEDCYTRVVDAYRAIFRRVGLPVLVVEADTGMMGGTAAHEFMLLADGGEDTLIVCPACDYAANQEVAIASKATGGADASHVQEPQELRALFTPGATTIQSLCDAAACVPAQTLKTVFYALGDETVLALIRGDLEVSEVRLRNLLGPDLRALSGVEAAARGLVVGYAGPVGLRVPGSLRLIADDSLLAAGPLVAGANRVEYHLSGVTYGRDYTADVVGDIATAVAGAACARCGKRLEARRGIEAGNTFMLGTRYSAAMGATFSDEAGNHRPLVMGCYGLGITRLLACVIEEHHDDDGIVWPASVAPYRYHLLTAGTDAQVVTAAAALYASLGSEQTLYDDRELSAGVKLKDADLLGMPVRITVSARSLAAGGAELRARRTGETRMAPLERVPLVADELVGEV
jgi:prolyl-tRNA synthetase